MKIYVAHQGDSEYTEVVHAGSDLDIAKSKREDENLEFYINVWENGSVTGRYLFDEDENVFIYDAIVS